MTSLATFAPIFNAGGITLSLVGSWILYKYGMPTRVKSNGASFLMLESFDEAAAALDAKYERFGRSGFLLMVFGNLAQLTGALIA